MEERQPTRGERLGSMILDHITMTLVALILAIPLFIKMTMTAMTAMSGSDIGGLRFFSGVSAYIALLGFALYFAKDSINGRSPAKRILHHQVVVHATGAAAGSIRTLIRNITLVLWPLEVIMVLISPTRRLGDLIAGTRVAYYERERPSSFSWGSFLLSILLAYGVMALTVLPVFYLQKKAFIDHPAVVQNGQYNEKESKELEREVNDSLSAYFSPQIKVYDKADTDSIESITITLRMTENFLNDEEVFDGINTRLKNIIYGKYPGRDFPGDVTYIYYAAGQKEVRSLSISRQETYVKEQ